MPAVARAAESRAAPATPTHDITAEVRVELKQSILNFTKATTFFAFDATSPNWREASQSLPVLKTLYRKQTNPNALAALLEPNTSQAVSIDRVRAALHPSVGSEHHLT